jgi:hypothetical protein
MAISAMAAVTRPPPELGAKDMASLAEPMSRRNSASITVVSITDGSFDARQTSIRASR